MERDYDVIVVGSGDAGLCAAIAAHDAGARVLIVESQEEVGGSSRLSGGVFYAAGTSVQRAAGYPNDTPDDMYDYYLTLNQWRVEPSVVRRFCDHAAPTLEWLMSIGVQFQPEKLYCSGVERIPRGHDPEGMGAAIVAALDQQVSKRGIDIALKTRVDKLLIEDGRVTGISAGGEQARAAAVVLATGGFGQNPEFLDRYYPESIPAGERRWSISGPGCQGDAIPLSQQAGAAITGFNHGLLLLTAGFNRILEVEPPGWLIYVNREGRRFVKETAAYAVMAGVVKEQGGLCWAIFDETQRANAAPDPALADGFAAGLIATDFVSWILEDWADKGRIIREPTLEKVADRAGISAAGLRTTVDQYNADVARGRDRQYYKDRADLRPIVTPPFYAIEMRPAIVALTSCGPRIDADAHVIDKAGRVIPGLYAAGEAAGSVLGERYIGGGNSVGSACVFGRIAGTNAAAEARGK